MVESQAIGRALRLGQEKNVHVVRYIMKGTVEEVRHNISLELNKLLTKHFKKEIHSQQTRKIEYSRVGWNEGTAEENTLGTRDDDA